MSRNLVEIVRRRHAVPEIRTNRLIGWSVDVNTSCPEYEVAVVDVRAVAEPAGRTPAIASAS